MICIIIFKYIYIQAFSIHILFQDTTFNYYDVEDDVLDEEIDDLIRRIPSPSTKITSDYAYNPKKLSFKKYLKEVNKADDLKRRLMQSKSVRQLNNFPFLDFIINLKRKIISNALKLKFSAAFTLLPIMLVKS